MKKKKNIYKSILVIVIIIYSIPLLSIMWTIGTTAYDLLINSHADYKNKKTGEQLEKYILEELNDKYSKDFSLDLLESEQYVYCGFSIDGSCLYTVNIKDTYVYLYEIKDENGKNARLRYLDPYYFKGVLRQEDIFENYGEPENDVFLGKTFIN